MSAVRGIFQCGIFWTRWYSNVDVCTFWCKKHRIFWNLWCVHTDEGFEPVRTFCGQGKGGQFFAILCRCSLWTAPNT